VSILDKLKKVGFSKLTSLDDAISKLEPFIKPNPIEEINIDLALNRILATDVETALDIPPFDRSAMDGYAVKAIDTFGATPKNPRTVKLSGQIEIGEYADLEIQEGLIA
jgi:molybdopterin biosynthesis enzyme